MKRLNKLMPLIKSTSKQAFEKNISKEVSAGKPEPQAVAIAYSEKRSAQKQPPAHSSHIEEMGSAYENHTASGGPSMPYHPVVELSRQASKKEPK